jgi:hypothetical protein
MRKDAYLEKAIIRAKKKVAIALKSILVGFETPQINTIKTTQEENQSDLSFATHGGV